MPHSFGQQLRAFSLAADRVSREVFNRILRTLTDYFSRELEVEFFEVLVPLSLRGLERGDGLQSIWHPGGQQWSQIIRDEEGNYNGQVSYAFDKSVELWIVPVDADELAGAREFQNLFKPGHALGADFPLYTDLTPAQIRTSIMLPLKIGNELLGLMNLESTLVIRPTEALVRELNFIREAIAHLYAVLKATEKHAEKTEHALSDLVKLAERPAYLHRRRIFVASSVAADDAVIEIVMRVVARYDIEVLFWREDPRSGDVRKHIFDNISSSIIGISYFSEPLSTGKKGYRDNENVLIEAGMMHALTYTEHMNAWIPLREKASPPVPFDFITERMVIIPRGEDGSLDERRFEKEFTRLLDNAISALRRS